jgi:predicted HAD superfamily phosphohydrolase YqeG
MEAIIFQLMRALAPQILAVVTQQFQQTGILPTATQLDSTLVAKREEAIKKGEDWLEQHKDK